MGKYYPITAEGMGGTDYTKAKFHRPMDMRNFPFAPVGPSFDLEADMDSYPLPRYHASRITPQGHLDRFSCMVGKCRPEETLDPALPRYGNQTQYSQPYKKFTKGKKSRTHPWQTDPSKKKF